MELDKLRNVLKQYNTSSKNDCSITKHYDWLKKIDFVSFF